MTILEKAQEIIYGDRARDYGHPRDNFQRIADLWNAYIRGTLADTFPELVDALSPQDVAAMMILVKLARLQNGYHEDSVQDIAGYAGTMERLLEPTEPVRESVPRVWDSLDDVPHDVRVEASGVVWEFYGPSHPDKMLAGCGWMWTECPSDFSTTGPFTEVL